MPGAQRSARTQRSARPLLPVSPASCGRSPPERPHKGRFVTAVRTGPPGASLRAPLFRSSLTGKLPATTSAGSHRSPRPPPAWPRTAVPPCGAPGRSVPPPAERRSAAPPRGSHHPLTSFCALGLTPSASSRRTSSTSPSAAASRSRSCSSFASIPAAGLGAPPGRDGGTQFCVATPSGSFGSYRQRRVRPARLRLRFGLGLLPLRRPHPLPSERRAAPPPSARLALQRRLPALLGLSERSSGEKRGVRKKERKSPEHRIARRERSGAAENGEKEEPRLGVTAGDETPRGRAGQPEGGAAETSKHKTKPAPRQEER